MAISCEVLAQLAKDYAENASYVKELPSVVQRELSRALVVAGAAIEQENNRKQYFSQVRHMLRNERSEMSRFSNVAFAFR